MRDSRMPKHTAGMPAEVHAQGGALSSTAPPKCLKMLSRPVRTLKSGFAIGLAVQTVNSSHRSRKLTAAALSRIIH